MLKRDFTLTLYRELLRSFLRAEFRIIPVYEYFRSPDGYKNILILRHDVDRKPGNSLRISVIESNLNIRSTYYFRIGRGSFDENIIRSINQKGHEIGYHYEEVASAGGDLDRAVRNFETNLKKIRGIAEVTTLCMHGSPLSRWDNRLIWDRIDYREFGLIGEPYMDIDFSSVSYLSDTGRRWDGLYSIRDQVNDKKGPAFRTTFELIRALQLGELSGKVMLTTHPQRWDDNYFPWLAELLIQSIKNPVKKYLRNKR